MANNNNLPQGYKQTELGIIPEDWEVKQISDFTSVVTGGTPSTQHAEYWGGDIRWMNSGELNLKFVYDVEGRITEEGLNNSSTHIIPAKCVLVGLAGQGKTRGTAAYNLVSLCTNQSIAAFLPTDTHSSLYLYYVIDSLYDYLRLLSSGDGGRGGLNKQILSSLNIVLPPLPEQKAIAEALSDVDDLITALDKKIAKKRLVKQGAMQELLTGKKRLPGFKEEWKDVYIKQLGKWRKGQSFSKDKIIVDGKNACIHYGELFGYGEVIENIKSYTNVEPVVKSSGKDVLFPASDVTPIGLGRCSALNAKNVLLGGDIIVLEIDKDYPAYISYVVNLNKMQIIDRVTGTTVKHISSTLLGDIRITISPNIEEQQAIATILSDMDKEIAYLEAQRDKYRLVKSGMMQKLLTGEIRLKKPQASQISESKAIPVDAHIIAGHIVNRLYKSEGWGRTKLQKSLHLAGYYAQIYIGNEYIRNTAGPDDQRLMNYIDQQFRQFNHVKITRVKLNNGKIHYNYTPTSLIQEVEMAYAKYPENVRKQIDLLLDKMNVMDLDCAEILSTLYGVWNNRIIKGESITDDLLIADFYAWSKHKLEFDESRLRKALVYMREENIVPIGWGKYIDKKN